MPGYSIVSVGHFQVLLRGYIWGVGFHPFFSFQMISSKNFHPLLLFGMILGKHINKNEKGTVG